STAKQAGHPSAKLQADAASVQGAFKGASPMKAVIAAAVMLAASSAAAQPPPRELFEEELTTISGEVQNVDYTQPGANFRVKDARSGVVWKVVGPTSNTLVRGGISAETRDVVTVAGYVEKGCTANCSLRLREMTFP